MPRFKIELVLNLIVEAENDTEAIDKVNRYLREHASAKLNPEFVLMDTMLWDDDSVPSDVV